MLNTDIILLDTSYIIFYRFFALLKWFSYAYKDEYNKYNYKKYNWVENTIYIDKYKKIFFTSILSLIKKYKKTILIANTPILIFCIDSDIKKSWRNKYYGNYKHRANKFITEYYDIQSIFEYTLTILIPDIINQYTNIYCIKVLNTEADDIIGSIVLWLNVKKYKNKIIICSNDSDFYQLGNKNIFFINFKTKNVITLTSNQAKHLLFKKIIYGDKSDCIKSIYESKSKLRLKSLYKKSKLKEYLLQNKLAYKQYLINCKLINFKYIPKKYVNKIIDKFKKIINNL